MMDSIKHTALTVIHTVTLELAISYALAASGVIFMGALVAILYEARKLPFIRRWRGEIL